MRQNVRVNDYERIARVIRYLDEKHLAQPSLAELAEQAGLSPFHFHRLFAAWSGVTPKDFLQCLTLAHVKQLLRQGGSVLEAALESGLSSPGRLHDLCVTLEAATPGEMKSGGAGIEIAFGFASTPFGEALLAETARGICKIAFVDGANHAEVMAGLHADWPAAAILRDDRAAAQMAREIFVRPKAAGPVPKLRAFIKGTEFQISVWRALVEVPAGRVTSYGRLAAAVDRPSAARAVGGAVGRNRVAFLIPCHRVIQETGVIGGFRWGPVRKRAILAWETAR